MSYNLGKRVYAENLITPVIGSSTNPVQTIYRASTDVYENDLKFVESSSGDTRLKIKTDGHLAVSEDIEFHSGADVEAINTKLFSIGLDDSGDQNFVIRDDQANQDRMTINKSTGEVTFSGHVNLPIGFETTLTNTETLALLNGTVAAQPLPDAIYAGTQKTIVANTLALSSDLNWKPIISSSGNNGVSVTPYGQNKIIGLQHFPSEDPDHIYAISDSTTLKDNTRVNYFFKINRFTNDYINVFDSVLPARDGFTSTVYDMDKYTDNLVIGGQFTSWSDGSPNARIVGFNITNQTFFEFDDLVSGNNGLNNGVYAVKAEGTSNIWVGGSFTAFDASGNAHKFAKFDLNSNTWTNLVSPFGIEGFDNDVFAIAIYGSKIYVAGEFTSFHGGVGGSVDRIAVYDYATNTYSALIDGTKTGLNNKVWSLEVVGDRLIVGGDFTGYTGGDLTVLSGFTTWDITNGSWVESTGTPFVIPHRSIRCLKTFDNSNVYVGGGFGEITTSPIIDADFIAKYDVVNDSWESLTDSSGVTGVTFNGLVYVPPAYVRDVVEIGDSVFVAGYFNNLTNLTLANGIAKFDYSIAPLTISGNLFENGVSIATKGIDTVGGSFDVIWNGSVWFVK